MQSCWCRESYFGKAGLLFPPSFAMALHCPLHLQRLRAASVGKQQPLPSVPHRCRDLHRLPAWRHLYSRPGVSDDLLLHQSGWVEHQRRQQMFSHVSGCFWTSPWWGWAQVLFWMAEKSKVKPFPSSLCHSGGWIWTSEVNKARRFCSPVFSHHSFLFRAGSQSLAH